MSIIRLHTCKLLTLVMWILWNQSETASLYSLSILPESFRTLDDMSKTQTLCAWCVVSTISLYISQKVKWYDFLIMSVVLLFLILLCSQKQSWKAYIFPLIRVKRILGFFLHLRWKTTVLQDGISNNCKRLRNPFLLSSRRSIFPTFLQIFPTARLLTQDVYKDFFLKNTTHSLWSIVPISAFLPSSFPFASWAELCVLRFHLIKKWLTSPSFSNMLTSFSFKCVLRFTVEIFMFN